YVFLTAVAALALSVTACEKKAPSAPSSSSAVSAEGAPVTDAQSGITLTAPTPVSPANNQQIRFSDQPIRLVVTSAVSTGTSSLTYTFEVARDSAFASIVSTKSGVEGSGQQTATLDRLAGATTYYWRARASTGSTTGPNSAGRSVQVGPEVVLQAPALAFPTQNGTLNGTPRLTVNNVGRSGPVGTVSYRFEISDSSSFSRILFSGNANEQGGGQTTIQLAASSLTSG